MIEVWHNAIKSNELENFSRAVVYKNIMEGPILKEFEDRIRNLLGVNYVIGTSSGSAALALAFMGIGIVPGDEVIVPDLTFIATANAAHLLGAEVVVAPVKRNQTLLDPDFLDEYITCKTKAIVTVDLNGRIACTEALKQKYSARGIYIVDDACQAFMSRDWNGNLSGTQADIACFSFGITKMVTTIMGGAVVTNNQEIYEKIRIMKTQGMPSIFEGDAYKYSGFNFKLPDVLASIGLAQLDRLDRKMRYMCEINEMYRKELSDVEGISFLARRNGELPWMTDIICENKDKVREVLYKNGISSRPLGKPLHTAHFLKSKGKYSTSDMMRKKMLYLPSGPDQDIANIRKVIHVLKSNDIR